MVWFHEFTIPIFFELLNQVKFLRWTKTSLNKQTRCYFISDWPKKSWIFEIWDWEFIKPFCKQLTTFYKMVINKFLFKVTFLKSIRSSYNMVKDLLDLLTLICMSYESKENAHLKCHLFKGNFYKTQ